jgi:transcriptional regulator with XRE-family HTH domain
MVDALHERLDAIRRKGALKNVQLAKLIGMRPETVTRWNRGRSTPHASTDQILAELECVLDDLGAKFSPQEKRRWFFAPNRSLQGSAPAELVRRGHMEEVRLLVDSVLRRG